jgi:uncharacterized protein
VKLRATLIAAAVVALVLAPAAAAHVTVNPSEWEADGFARFAIRVPNERENAATTRIALRFPDQILSASFQPIEGWRRSVEMRTLDEPIDVEGEQVTEKIHTVTWSGGRIRPGEFQEFGMSLRVPNEPGAELAFPAVQTYSGGEVVRWIGPPDSDEPAPRVAITEPEPEGSEAAAPAQPPGRDDAAGSEESGGSDTLSIVALVAGLAGLVAGLLALFGRGGRFEATRPRDEVTSS